MRSKLDCIPCFIQQTLEAVRMVAPTNINLHNNIVKAVMRYLMNTEQFITKPPPYISTTVHRIIRELSNNPDPYREVKIKSNEYALKLYPKLKRLVNAGTNADDKLLTAVKLAIAGNSIDFGTQIRFAIETTIEKVLNNPLDINDYEKFKDALMNSSSILYIGDNAGEIVFDRILVEELAKTHEIIFAVKPGPIINDATVTDAEIVGLTDYAKIITTGTQSPGAYLELCSEQFRKYYDTAELVIAKGQGNYEALEPPYSDKLLFFMLMVKCKLVAEDLGGRNIKIGDLVLTATTTSSSSR